MKPTTTLQIEQLAARTGEQIRRWLLLDAATNMPSSTYSDEPAYDTVNQASFDAHARMGAIALNR